MAVMMSMGKDVFCLGFFDSLHRGHRKLIAKGEEYAKKSGGNLVVMTFDDGIYSALGLNIGEIYLLRERLQILMSLGAKAHILPSNNNFLSQSAEEFLKYLEKLEPFAIVAGTDYRFGKNKLGTASYLLSYFSNRGVKVDIIELLENDGRKISTTRIRDLIGKGEIEEANALLGEPYFISGKVVKGRQNGQKIGIPTANVEFDIKKFLPKSGVYATKTFIGGKSYLSVSNVGEHPTFKDSHVNFETHIINFDIDIYGVDIKVEFYKFLREVIAYPSIDELIHQINRDIQLTIRSFNND